MSDQVSGDTGRTERRLFVALRELAAATATALPGDDRLRQTETAIVAGLALVALEELERRAALAPEPSGVPPKDFRRLVEAHALVGKVGATELRNGRTTTGYQFTPDELDDFITLVRGIGVSGATTEVERVAYATLLEAAREGGTWAATAKSASSGKVELVLTDGAARIIARVVARLGATPKEDAR